MEHKGKVYREKTAIFKDKPLRVISIRVSDEDAEFLKSLPNASEFIREAIAEGKRRQAKLESKGLPSEIVSEIAQAYTKHQIQWLQDDNYDLQCHSEGLSGPLFEIAQLTLDCPNPFSSNKESVALPESMYLNEVCENLQSEEAKSFIQRIKNKKVYSGPFGERKTEIIPLDADELETVRKIYDEAKMLLEKGYRKTFHKLPPEDWHLTIIDGRQERKHVRLRYKLP
jgi:hypothetical protein